MGAPFKVNNRSFSSLKIRNVTLPQHQLHTEILNLASENKILSKVFTNILFENIVDSFHLRNFRLWRCLTLLGIPISFCRMLLNQQGKHQVI